MNTPIVRALVATALAAACASQPQPQDMTAAEHEREASAEERAAAEHERRYDPDSRVTTGSQLPTSPAFYGTDVYNPTESNLAAAREHRRHAEAHRAAAAALRDFEEAECGQFPPASRAACPLLLDLVSIEDIEGGVLLRFAAGADVEPVIAHLRCHLAYAAAAGREGIDACALYVPGATLERVPEGAVLTTNDDDLVAELRQRARVHEP